MRIRLQAVAVSASLAFMCGACFPTFQSSRVEPGWQFNTAAMAMSGHRVDYHVSGPDYMITVTPAYGFGRRFEIGVPLGMYQSGRNYTYPVLLPYAKLALGNEDDREHLAIFAQASGALGAVFSQDRRWWEPQLMVAHLGSAGGQHGDFAFYSRYAEDNQTLWAASVGASLKTPQHQAFEIGVLRNSYTTSQSHLIYDLFVRMKIGTR